jgi:ubiquitin C-terminal hydrolase
LSEPLPADTNDTTPTVVFAQLHFSAVLFRELELSTDDNYQKYCQQLLNLLPSDETVVSSLSEMPQYIESLRNSPNQAVFLYKLQILIAKLDTDVGHMFQMSNGCEFLATYLLSQSTAFRGLAKVLWLLINLATDSEFQRAEELIPCLLRLFYESLKHQPLIAQLLYLCARYNPSNATKIVFRDIPLLKLAMSVSMEISREQFVGFLDLLSSPLELCRISLENIDHKHVSFPLLLFDLIHSVDDEAFLKSALDACVARIPTATDVRLVIFSQIISSLLGTHPDWRAHYSSVLHQLLPVVFVTELDQIREHLLDACTSMITGNPDDHSFQILRRILDFESKRWNYRPLLNAQTLPGFVGLRNLGSTCYMNAIFQQLFWTYPFRHLILTSEMTEPWQNELKRIFAELLLSKRRFTDTQAFCACWTGWDKQLINPREQQDAYEFLQLLLDRLPAFHGMFQGTITNTIQGVHDTFESQSPELFYTIPLEIHGLENVEESFEYFLQSELFTGENQISIGDRKIDARKFSRIAKAPEVLVLQLKRFQYDLKTLIRLKVNDRYKFPFTLNIAQCLVESEDSVIYQLQGVVVHSGTAQAGHYSSIIRLGDRLVLFSDNEVSELTDYGFEKATGGQDLDFDSDHVSSAYLLFYVKDDATVTIGDTVLSFDSPTEIASLIDPLLRADIEQANLDFIHTQALFSDSAVSFFCSLPDPECFLKYFLNVFCHSSLASRCPDVSATLDHFFCDPVAMQFTITYIKEHFSLVADIFLNCGENEIIVFFTKFFRDLIMRSDQDTGFQLLEQLFPVLQEAIAGNWKQVSVVSRCFARVLQARSEFVAMAVAHNWILLVSQAITAVYKLPRSAHVLQNLDLSDLFVVCHLLSESQNSPSDFPLHFVPAIFQSRFHGHAFVVLLDGFFRRGHIQVASFLETFAQTKEDLPEIVYQFLIRALCGITDEAEFAAAVDQISQHRLLGFVQRLSDEVSDPPSAVAELLFRFPRHTVFRFVVDESPSTREAAFRMAQSLFPDVPTKISFPLLPIRLSATAIPRMERLLAETAVFVNGITDQGPLCESSNDPISELDFRLLHFIRLLKWMVFADGNFKEKEFETVCVLHKKLAARQTQPLDLNVLACIRLLTFFPTALVAPHFAEWYAQVMSRLGNLCFKMLTALRNFRHYFPALSLEQLRFVVTHESFSVMRFGFIEALGARKGEAVELIVSRLISNARDPICQQAIVTLLDIDYGRFSVRSPNAYAQLLEAVVDSLPGDSEERMRWIALGKAAGIPPSLTAAFGLVLCRHGKLDLLAVDLDAFANAIALSPDPNLVPPVADFLAAVASTDGEQSLRRVIGKCREAIERERAALAKERFAAVAVSVIVSSAKVVEELREFYQFLEDRGFWGVIEAAFYPTLLSVWNGSAGWAEAFVLQFTDSQADEYGGVGKAGAFFRAVVHRMEAETGRKIVQRLALHGLPTKDGKWKMLATLFERFPQHAEEFRAILGFGELASVGSADMKPVIEFVVGHPVQEIPRSESSGTLERSGSEEHGFEVQETGFSPGLDDDDRFGP